MRKALALVAVAAMSVTVASPSLAAAKKPKPKPVGLPKAVPLVITDAAGDANGINNQGGLLPASPPEQSTPQGQRAAADITSVTVSRLDDKKTVLGLIFDMKLTAAPDKGTAYTVEVRDPACNDAANADVMLFRYFMYLDGSTKAFVREICGDTDKTTPLINVKVVGNDVVFTVPFAEMPPHIAKPGVTLLNIDGDTVGGLGSASTTYLGLPYMDLTPVAAGPYKIGQ